MTPQTVIASIRYGLGTRTGVAAVAGLATVIAGYAHQHGLTLNAGTVTAALGVLASAACTLATAYFRGQAPARDAAAK